MYPRVVCALATLSSVPPRTSSTHSSVGDIPRPTPHDAFLTVLAKVPSRHASLPHSTSCHKHHLSHSRESRSALQAVVSQQPGLHRAIWNGELACACRRHLFFVGTWAPLAAGSRARGMLDHVRYRPAWFGSDFTSYQSGIADRGSEGRSLADSYRSY